MQIPMKAGVLASLHPQPFPQALGQGELELNSSPVLVMENSVMSDEHNHGEERMGEFGPDETLADLAHHHVNYTAIFILLCVCTGLSWGFDIAKDSLTYPTLIVLVLGVAVCKATFVLLYFMHIRFERAWKYVLLAPTAVLACALPFALAPDIAFHYYNVSAPQRDLEAAEHDAHAAPGHATDTHGEPGHAADAGHEPHGDAGHDHKAGEKDAHKSEKKHEKLDGEHEARPTPEKTSK